MRLSVQNGLSHIELRGWNDLWLEIPVHKIPRHTIRRVECAPDCPDTNTIGRFGDGGRSETRNNVKCRSARIQSKRIVERHDIR